MLKLKPLSDIIVVRPLDNEKTTRGGIHLPDTAQPQKLRGQVVAAGPGRRLDDGTVLPMEVQVGDRVVYQKYSGDEYMEDGEVYRIMHASNIFGKFEGGI
jgi:chaperonin GroES